MNFIPGVPLRRQISAGRKFVQNDLICMSTHFGELLKIFISREGEIEIFVWQNAFLQQLSTKTVILYGNTTHWRKMS